MRKLKDNSLVWWLKPRAEESRGLKYLPPSAYVNLVLFPNLNLSLYNCEVGLKIEPLSGAGPVAQWLHSRAPLQAAQCFVSLNPGQGHSTAHQTTLRQRPICHNQKDPQRRIYNYVPGGLWGEKGKNKTFKKKNREMLLTKHTKMQRNQISSGDFHRVFFFQQTH